METFELGSIDAIFVHALLKQQKPGHASDREHMSCAKGAKWQTTSIGRTGVLPKSWGWERSHLTCIAATAAPLCALRVSAHAMFAAQPMWWSQ